MDYSQDGRFVAVAGHPPDAVEIVLAEKDGKGSELATRTADFSHVRLLKPDGTVLTTFPQPRVALSMAFSPDSRWLAVLNWFRWEVRIYDTTTLSLDGTMPVWVHGGMRWNNLDHLAWSPDGRFLALSGRGLAAVVCDMKRRLPVAKSAAPVSSQACFAADSSALIAQQDGTRLCVFDLAHSRPTGIGGKPLKNWPFPSVFGLWDGAWGDNHGCQR